MWLIETALASAQAKEEAARPAARPSSKSETSQVASITDGSDLAAAETELLVALTSELDSLKKLNAFQVLGLGYEATDADVRAAFGELTKRYHPDRYARFASADLRHLAAEIFILIRDAYRRLGDAAGRVQVLQSLGKSAPAPRAVPSPSRTPPSVPPPRATQRVAVPASPVAPVLPTVTVPVPAVLRPPGAPRRDALHRSTGDREPPPAPVAPPAPPLAAGSTTAPPGRAPSTPPVDRRATTSPFAQTQQVPVLPSSIDAAELAALEDLIDQARLDEALAGYRMLAKRNAHDRNAHDRNVRAGAELCEGLLALAARDRLEAAQRFETALEIDPSNERAARELAEMRRQATTERKGLLSRLMGKKEP
jgi:tetratricopeptide (TPR) repeat protein